MSKIRGITNNATAQLIGWEEDGQYFVVTRDAAGKPATVHVRGAQLTAGLVVFTYNVDGTLNEIRNSGLSSRMLDTLYFEARMSASVQNASPSYWLSNGDTHSLALPTGGIAALSELTSVVTLTATGLTFTGPCEYTGIKVRAYVGGPQTITVYDALSAVGTPIDTIGVNGLGTWLWDRRDDDSTGPGSRRQCSTGCHVVISGGTSRTIDVMVE